LTRQKGGFKPKKQTKTNVALQKQIGIAVDAIVAAEIERLRKLHSEYNIPLEGDAAGSAYKGYVYPFGSAQAKADEGVYDRMRFNLVFLLTKREMYRRGYAYSYDGKESEWQELENRNERFDSIRNKYPWL